MSAPEPALPDRTAGRPAERPSDLHATLDALATESVDPALADLDTRSTLDLVRLMSAGDQRALDAVAACAEPIAHAVDGIADRLARGGRLFYVGAGTPGRLGVLDASEIPPTFGADPSLVQGVIAGGDEAVFRSIEAAEDDADQGAADLVGRDIGPDDAVVGISASGRTPYVIGALRAAREVGALAIAVANNEGSQAAAAADITIEAVVGPEFISGSTRLRSGTAQKLVLNQLSTLTMVRLGKTFGNLMVDVQASNDKLRARAERLVVQASGGTVDDARSVLADADGHVKTAILMRLRGIDAPAARDLLERHHGHLRAAVDSATPTGTAARPVTPSA